MEFLIKGFMFIFEWALMFFGAYFTSGFGVILCMFVAFFISQLPFYDKIKKYIEPPDPLSFMSGAMAYGGLLVFLFVVLESMGKVVIIFNW